MIGECSICNEKKEIRNIAYHNSNIHAVAVSMHYSAISRWLCDDCINKLDKEGRIIEKNGEWTLLKTMKRCKRCGVDITNLKYEKGETVVIEIPEGSDSKIGQIGNYCRKCMKKLLEEIKNGKW